MVFDSVELTRAGVEGSDRKAMVMRCRSEADIAEVDFPALETDTCEVVGVTGLGTTLDGVPTPEKEASKVWEAGEEGGGISSKLSSDCDNDATT